MAGNTSEADIDGVFSVLAALLSVHAALLVLLFVGGSFMGMMSM